MKRFIKGAAVGLCITAGVVVASVADELLRLRQTRAEAQRLYRADDMDWNFPS